VDEIKLVSWHWSLSRLKFASCLFYEWCWNPRLSKEMIDFGGVVVTPSLKLSRIIKRALKSDIGYINYTIQKRL
jgi:hypothetical protein